MTTNTPPDKDVEMLKEFIEHYGMIGKESLLQALSRLTPRKSASEAMEAFIDGVIGYWTTSNDCLPSKEEAERLKYALTSEPVAGWMPIENNLTDCTETAPIQYEMEKDR